MPLTPDRLAELLAELPARGPAPADSAALRELLAGPLAFVRVDPAAGARRYYALAWQVDLLGVGVLTRTWGRLGRAKRVSTAVYPTPGAAWPAVRASVRARLRHGYRLVADP